MAIPKIIHQTCRSYDALAPELKDNIRFIKENNPGWEHHLYDDAAVRQYFARHLSAPQQRALENLNPKYGVVLADLFRYLVVYHQGGVYLDVKSTARLPLDRVLRPEDSYLISQWPNRLVESSPGAGLHIELFRVAGGEFQQWHVIAEPGHAFLRNVLSNVLFNCANYSVSWFGVGKLGVLRVSGPICYTMAVVPLLPLHAHRIVSIDELGFRYSIYEEMGKRDHHARDPEHYSRLRERIFLR